MVADMFTKAVDKPTFLRMRNMMMNIHGALRTALEKSFSATSGSLRRLLGSVYNSMYNALIADELTDERESDNATREKPGSIPGAESV